MVYFWLISSLLYFFIGAFVFWCFDLVGEVVSLGLISSCWFDLRVLFILDGLSLVSVLMLFICGSIALVYSCYYFNSLNDSWDLFYLIVGFLSVMFMLFISGSSVASLVFWEYLGLVSFFLILYYSNSSSLRGSLITLVSSRFGDVGFFVFVGCFLSGFCFSVGFMAFFLLLIVVTKSACYPFVSWLLEAMRAPTPVSSLVHSSTLVAAGVWFLLRYGLSLDNSFLLMWSFVGCLLGIVLSSLCACVQTDFKKLVALSTCNNISWCVVYYIFGNTFLCLAQLLCHGISKCFLFMSVGDLMSSSGSAQDGKGIYSAAYGDFCGCFVRFILSLGLTGAPFIGVFFSKHGLFCEIVFSFSVLCGLFTVSGFILTMVYSVRFLLHVVGNFSGLGSSQTSVYIMSVGSLILCLVINYFFIGLLEERWVSSHALSGLLLFSQLFGCWIGFELYSSDNISVLESIVLDVGGCDSVVGFVNLGLNYLQSIVSSFSFRWESILLSYLCSMRGFYFLKFFVKPTGAGGLVLGVFFIFISFFNFG